MSIIKPIVRPVNEINRREYLLMKALNTLKNLLWGESLLSKAGGIVVILTTLYFIFKFFISNS
jgi:hypothetical protein